MKRKKKIIISISDKIIIYLNNTEYIFPVEQPSRLISDLISESWLFTNEKYAKQR